MAEGELCVVCCPCTSSFVAGCCWTSNRESMNPGFAASFPHRIDALRLRRIKMKRKQHLILAYALYTLWYFMVYNEDVFLCGFERCLFLFLSICLWTRVLLCILPFLCLEVVTSGTGSRTEIAVTVCLNVLKSIILNYYNIQC